MTTMLCLLHSIYALMGIHVPVGAQLHVRMMTPVATWSTQVDSPIRAVLIAPVVVAGQPDLPAGCVLSGRVTGVTRVGFGIRHEKAALGLEFTSITLPGGETTALAARVMQVDNARERVSYAGLIQGGRATSSIAYRVSGYIKMALLWHFHAEVVEWALKSLVVQLPEPEIFYPAGTELTLDLTGPLRTVASPGLASAPLQFADAELSELRTLAAGMPFRTSDPQAGRPSDLTNVLLIGSRRQIEDAFRAAGWNLARPLSMRSRINYLRAVAETRGYAAPMNALLLNGEDADMCWQKGLNDVSKRHHVRVWKQPTLWHGQAVWMAAATRDVDFAYLRPGRIFTHRIDPDVDAEREKVANDLVFASCASAVARIARPQVPSFTHNGTGDAFSTDTRLTVVRLNACAQPAEGGAETATVTARGGAWQRLVRREILVTRSDLIRANMYWRIFEGTRWTLGHAWNHRHGVVSGPTLADALTPESSPRRQAWHLAFSTLP